MFKKFQSFSIVNYSKSNYDKFKSLRRIQFGSQQIAVIYNVYKKKIVHKLLCIFDIFE